MERVLIKESWLVNGVLSWKLKYFCHSEPHSGIEQSCRVWLLEEETGVNEHRHFEHEGTLDKRHYRNLEHEGKLDKKHYRHLEHEGKLDKDITDILSMKANWIKNITDTLSMKVHVALVIQHKGRQKTLQTP